MKDEPRIIIRTIHGDIDLGLIQDALPKLLGIAAESIRATVQANSAVHKIIAEKFVEILDPKTAPAADAKTIAANLMFMGLGFARSAMIACQATGQEIHMHCSKESVSTAAMPIVAPGTPTGGNC